MALRILNFDDGFTSNSAPTSSGATIEIAIDGYLYFGDADTNGSWRLTISGGNLIVQKRVSGVWTTAEDFVVE